MKRLGWLLFAFSIVSVHVIDIVGVVVDAYRTPDPSILRKEHHRVVGDVSVPSQETDVDFRFSVEFIAVFRFVNTHPPIYYDQSANTGQERPRQDSNLGPSD